MTKSPIGPRPLIFPTPATLIGTNVDGKPNFMAAAWVGVACSNPPMVTVAVQHPRYTYRGIEQNMTLSVNIPSVDQVREADYCGMASGSKVNKVAVCGFTVFYGGLKTAPMIEQCPVNLECKVMHTLDLGSHTLFIAQVLETYVTDACLTDGKPDVAKIKPFSYDMIDRRYLALGSVIGKAFSSGKELAPPKAE